VSHFHTWKTTINCHITISQTKSQWQVVDAQINNPAQSKIVQNQIIVSLPNKRTAQDVLVISAP
jgi:hypothetical protein